MVDKFKPYCTAQQRPWTHVQEKYTNGISPLHSSVCEQTLLLVGRASTDCVHAQNDHGEIH